MDANKLRLLVIVLLCPMFCAEGPLLGPAAAQTSLATNADQWVVRVPETYQVQTSEGLKRLPFPDGIKQTHCDVLRDFLKNPRQFDYNKQIRNYADDKVTSKRIGKIEGFAIYDVIHQFDDGEQATSDWYIKLILIERAPGEFCEIFDEVSDGVFFVRPSYLTRADSVTVLVSEDPVNGNCGCYSSGYWTFDRRGPIFLDVGDVIEEAQKRDVPPGLGPWHGAGFDIQTLTYSYGFSGTALGSGGGTLRLKFALKNHQLVVVSQDFDGGQYAH